MKIVIGITGASGTIYARQLIEQLQLLTDHRPEITIIVTDNGKKVAQWEHECRLLETTGVTFCDNNDFFASPASGSSNIDAMVIVPCSMGMLGRIAGGISDDLISRSADVMLKERRKLILVTREAPLNSIHLRNMLTLSDCGAVICPASPSFYNHPEDMESLCATVTNRVLSLLGLPCNQKTWGVSR